MRLYGCYYLSQLRKKNKMNSVFFFKWRTFVIVSGCLKLLSPEELEHLDIPSGNESPSPVSRVLYMSENDSPFISGTAILSGQHTEATKFNLFTGNQTLDQRDNSFKVISCVAHVLTRFFINS